MRKFKVLYSDKTFSDRKEKYETKNEYDMREAQEMAEVLAMMGCCDFEFVPVKSGEDRMREAA